MFHCLSLPLLSDEDTVYPQQMLQERTNSTFCFYLVWAIPGLPFLMGTFLQNLSLDSFNTSVWWEQTKCDTLHFITEVEDGRIVGILTPLLGIKYRVLETQSLFLSNLESLLLSRSR